MDSAALHDSWQHAVGSVILLQLVVVMSILALACAANAAQLGSVPEGYNLQLYDDCGVVGRQPHIPTNLCYTFPEGSVTADIKARTVTYGVPNFDAVYDGLNPAVPYVLAVTYASERGNPRVQSLSAGSTQLHGAHALPDGSSERLIFEIPSSAIQSGRLTLHFTLNSGPNAVASILELWAPLPAPNVLYVEACGGTVGQLRGTVSSISYDGVAGAQVEISDESSGVVHATTTTLADGSFAADVSDWVKPNTEGTIKVTARSGGLEASTSVPFFTIFFPPRFAPIPAEAGLAPAPLVLDGTWRINPSPSTGFQTDPTTNPGWSNFTVPGQWLQQGFDVPRDRTVAVATDFQIPASWSGKRIILRFDAVHGGTDYWLNGVHLGYSENLMTPVEFDITGAASVGQSNHLAMGIKVQTPSETASYTSDYAFHNLGGIDRSVHLFALPAVHLSSLHHTTLLDAAYRDSTLSVEMDLKNSTASAASGLTMRVLLTDPDGAPVALSGGEFDVGSVQPGETHVSRQFQVSNPLKWSAEKPHLYKLSVELLQSGNLLERLEQNVGFRKVEVKGSQLLVNGVPVKLAGICRHETDPLTGRSATAVHAEEDARLLKGANFNFVRTSHYPPTREFLDACDKIGLYVESEAPFCWARNGCESDPAQAANFLSATSRMIDYNRDHPSVIIWSLGNESGSGPDGPNSLPANFALTLSIFHQQDPSRPTIFNNEWSRDGGACDIACLHYPPFPPEEYTYVKDDPRPIQLDEYFPPQTFTFPDELALNPGLDVVNWSTGQNSPSSYWSQIYNSSRVIGGSIWAGIDEEFYFADGSVKGYGPWGFVDVWRRPKSLWWDAKRIHSPVWIPVRRLDYTLGQESVSVPVENRYSFTDLSELRASWEVAGSTGDLQVSLAPRSSGHITVPIPASTPSGSLLALRFFDSDNQLITADGITLGDGLSHVPPTPGSGCPQWYDNGQVIVISGKSFRLVLNHSDAEVRPQDCSGSVKLLKFPRLFVSRQETKNVFNPGGVAYAQFPDEASRVIDSVTVEARGQALAVVVRDHYTGYAGQVELLIDNDGVCTASFDYTYSGDPFTVSETGLRFLMDSNCQEISWQRRTEWDVYPDDHIGRPEGTAKAYRGPEWGNDPLPYNVKPPWPWYLDSNQYGTRDFRTAKYNIYWARLLAPDGSGLQADSSDGSTTVRACLSTDGVQFHTLVAQTPHGISSGARLAGSFNVSLLSAGDGSAQGWEFASDGNLEGWCPTHNIGNLHVSGGSLIGDITGPDPYVLLCTGYWDINADADKCLRIRMKIDSGSTAQLYWMTKASPSYDEAKHIDFSVVPDGQFHEYTIDLSGNDQWSGTVTRFRLDPSVLSSGHFEIDYIRIPHFGPPWEFSTDGDTEDWEAVNNCANLQSAGGLLGGDITGVDPQIANSDFCRISADVNKYIYLRMKVSSGAHAGLYWKTGSGELKGTQFGLVGDGQSHDYVVDLSGNTDWTGWVSALRIDPSEEAAGGRFEIDFIRTLSVLPVLSFSGKITDASTGKPVAYATVAGGASLVISDENGEYTTSAPVGSVTLHASRFAYNDADVAFTLLPGDASKDFTMTPKAPNLALAASASASGADPGYPVSNVNDGDANTLWQSHPGESGSERLSWVVFQWPTTQTIDSVFLPACQLVDLQVDAWRNGSWQKVAESSTDGMSAHTSYLLQFTPVLTDRIRVTRCYYAREIEIYNLNGTAPADTLSGTVRNSFSKKGLANAVITIGGTSTFSGENGRYSMSVPTGPAIVSVSRPPYTPNPATRVVTVPASNVDFDLVSYNIAPYATASASSSYAGNPAQFANDGDLTTRFSVKPGDSTQEFFLQWSVPATLTGIKLYTWHPEWMPGALEVYAWNGSAWVLQATAPAGATVWAGFGPVTTTKIKLHNIVTFLECEAFGTLNAGSVGAARGMLGAQVSFSGSTTAVFPDAGYVEDFSRSSGVRVEPSTSFGAQDAIATVVGMLGMDGFERAVLGSSVTTGGPNAIAPVMMPNASLSTLDIGAGTVGLLVKTVGKIVRVEPADGGASYLYVDDGSLVPSDIPGVYALKVGPVVSSYGAGDYVGVTGIGRLMDAGGAPIRVLQPRASSDVCRLR